ncbi:MAG: sensor domain-containing diguanylate cyclase [Acidimicrobiales bacterium]
MGADKLLGAMRAMVVTVDGAGTVRDVRGPLEELLGRRPDELLGRSLARLVAEEDLDLLRDGFGPLPVPGAVHQPAPFRLHLLTVDGGRLPVDVLVSNLPDEPEVAGWVAVLVPRQAMATITEPLELLLADAPLEEVMRAALRALRGPAPAGRAPFAVALCHRLGDGAALEDRSGGARRGVVAGDGVPAALLDAIGSCDATEVVPLWRTIPPGTVRDVELDELPLVVTAVARVHGLVAARLAAVEVDGRVEAALLSFYDERAWAHAQGPWRRRWEQVVQALAVALHHRQAQHRQRLAATHDGLTGLANRRHFMRALDAHRGDVAVLYVDLDRFKQINERHGHFAGDRVLAEVARRLREVCRVGDLVARLGGDEFGVLLAGATTDEAEAVGRRIIEAVTRPLPPGVGPLSVGVSVGLAGSQALLGGRPAVVELADRAMYRAKRAGGGRLAVAHPHGRVHAVDDDGHPAGIASA